MATPGFTIPNAVDAAFERQAGIYETDIDALVAGFAGTCVVAGCAVTAQGSPDMTVAVAAGVITVDGVSAVVTAGNVTITAAHATLDRIDLVVANNAGTKSVVAGTAGVGGAAGDVVPPAIPASSVLLAMVYVPATDTTIATNQIVDKRVLRPTTAGRLAVKVSRTTNQSISNNSFTAISWDTEVIDIEAWHDPGTNPDRLTVPAGAPTRRYTVIASCYWDANATGDRAINITKNGSSVGTSQVRASANGITALQAIAPGVSLAAGDYVNARGFQDSGGSLNLTGTDQLFMAVIEEAA